MIDNLINKLGSLSKALEFIYLVHDVKPCCRFIIDQKDFLNIKDLCNKHSLNYSLSDFKILMETDKDKNFSNKGVRIDIQDKKPGFLIIYISKNHDHQKANEYEYLNNHYNLGLTLGYPECCCKFFQNNYPIQSKKHNDYIMPALKNSKDFILPFQTNILARYFDYTLLNHFPCNFNCKASIEQANRHLGLIKELDLQLHNKLLDKLKCTAIYTEYDGTHLLYNYHFKDNTLTFKEVSSTTENHLSIDLKKAKTLEMKEIRRIRLKDQELSNVGVAIFH